MKKYLYIAIALFACTLGFTACGNDSDDSGYPIVPDKGAAVAGNYNGKWTIKDLDGNVVATANGTVILAKDGEAKDYVVVSMAENAGARLKAMNSKANIAQQAKRFILHEEGCRATYYNYYTGKKWGTAESYDLCIDSSILGLEDTEKLIADFIRKRFEL